MELIGVYYEVLVYFLYDYGCIVNLINFVCLFKFVVYKGFVYKNDCGDSKLFVLFGMENL